MGHIERKVRRGKAMLVAVAATLLGLSVFEAIVFINGLKQLEWVLFVVVFAFMIMGIVYLRVFRSICSSYKYSKKYAARIDLENFDNDIFDLPASKTVFGKEVFYCAKTGVVLPYSMVAWVYVHQINTYGDAILRQLAVRCRDGRSAFLNIPDEEIVPLIKCISEKCSDLIIGYGTEQNEEYKKLVCEFKISNKR